MWVMYAFVSVSIGLLVAIILIYGGEDPPIEKWREKRRNKKK